MRNLISTSFFAVILTVTLFSCNNSAEPQPDASQHFEAKQNESSNSQSKLASRFQWKLAKTGVFGNGQKVSLKTPVGMGYMVGGDFAYQKQYGRGALIPLTVKFYNLKNIDKNTVDPAMLDAVRFNSYTIPAADETHVNNVLFTNTIVAIKDESGKYYILEVVNFIGFEIKVNIYEESIFTGNAKLPYELPD